MPHFKINDIIGKLNELRAVFVLGQRALPFIEEIFGFLKEVAPLMEEINASMMDSALMVPHATSQLQNISDATRAATTEILDLIDAVMLQSDTYDGHLEQTMSDVQAMEKLGDKALSRLNDALEDQPDVLAEISEIFEESSIHLHNISSGVHARRTVIDEIRGQMNRIVMSLQMQDVTAQQIASVTHLLDTMRDRMAKLLEQLDAHSMPSEYQPWEMQEDAAFNPLARYEPADEKQEAADAVVAAMQSPEKGGETDVEEIFRSAALAMQMRRGNGSTDDQS